MTMTVVAPLQQLAERTGLEVALLERPAVHRYLQARCRQLGLADEAAYLQFALRDPGELERLIQEISVPETWFFRYPASFQLLIDHAARLQHSKVDRLRMLSVACATGEEPYGMAMAAASVYPLERIAVDGVDRNESSLVVARAGRYRLNSFRETMPLWGERWFDWAGDVRQVDARIRSIVQFDCGDVLSSALTDRPPYQVIFCRNLFIYLGESARRRLIDWLLSVLDADGLLFVGHAETAILPDHLLESAKVANTFAVRRKQAAAAAPATPKPPRKPTPKRVAAAKPKIEASRPQQTVVESQPRSKATLELARQLADTGQQAAAIAMLEELQPLLQTDSEALALLGTMQLSVGRLELARAAFNKVLYLEPNHEQALIQMAIVCDRLGQAAQAARFRRRAARVHDQEVGPQQ